MNATTDHVVVLRPEMALSRSAAAVLRLLRPANIVTAVADVLTGCVILSSYDSLPALLLSTSALYGGGVALNDYFDRHVDSIERPERPIPSRDLSPGVALSLGFALLVIGVVAGFVASSISGIIAALIAACVLVYDCAAKKYRSGALIMATCRGLNLLLGLSAVPAALRGNWHMALIPFAYIAAITTLSRGEVHGGSRRISTITLGIVAASVIGIAAIGRNEGAVLFQLPFLAFLLIRVGPPLWRACCEPQASHIREAVHAGVVSLIVVDAALAAGFAGLVYGAAILSLSVLAGEFARRFPVT